ncbi:MAG: hypothetical protein R6V14_03610 [Halanaerobiales bacterium]
MDSNYSLKTVFVAGNTYDKVVEVKSKEIEINEELSIEITE